MVTHFEGRDRTARRQSEQARALAVAGRWDEAAQLNREILQNFPRDVDALNRLGKALTQLGQYDEALEVYRNALVVEPQSGIAQRNVGRLEQLAEAVASGAAPLQPQGADTRPIEAGVFVEEVGKTYLTDLVRPSNNVLFTGISPADEVELRVEGTEVLVFDRQGQRIGQLEPRIARRMVQMVEAGNRFKAYVVALTGDTVRVILREVYRNPEARWRISFPRQATIAAPRPYLRETHLTELVPDVLYDLEEEEEDLEEEGEEAEAGGDDAEEEEEFLEEPAAADEEENPLGH